MEPKHIALVLGLAGGATIGFWGFKHMFVQGMTDDERKQMLGYGLVTSTLLIASQMDGVSDWLTVEGLGTKIDKWFATL